MVSFWEKCYLIVICTEGERSTFTKIWGFLGGENCRLLFFAYLDFLILYQHILYQK